MSETELLQRITVNPKIFGGKSIMRARHLVEHILLLSIIDSFIAAEQLRGNGCSP